MKRVTKLFSIALVVGITALVYNANPTAGFGITAFIGIAASMKAKGVTVTPDQEGFLNEIDAGVKAQFEAQANNFKTLIDNLKTALETEKTGNADLKTKLQTTIEAFDKLQEKFAGLPGGGAPRQKSYVQEMEDLLTEAKKLGKLTGKSPFAIDEDWNNGTKEKPGGFQRKAVGDMTMSNTTGSYFIPPDVKPGIVMRPFNQIHMRDLHPLGRTDSNVIRHIRDNGGEGGPTVVAAGATKPQMDRDLSIEDANVRKIATYLRINEEMIEDIPYITSFLTNIGTEEVLAVEDTQILYGDGTGENLSGLMTNATAFAAGTSVVAAPNRFDVLRAARKQMRVAKRFPTYALVSPADYFVMTSAKDSTNNYILQGGGNGLIPTLDGVPIIEMNQIVEGDFLLGDRLAAEIDFRKNMVVRFYEQDQDNAIKNKITIVIEERLALPIYYTAGFIKGTFSAAITDLTS